MVNSRTPTPRTSTSPMIRAITSPVGVRSIRAIGQEMTPRSASLRIFARIRALAVASHHRLPIRGPSLSSVPPAKANTAQPTAPEATSPRSKASAVSIARPSRMAGSTTAMFIKIPAREPNTI